MWRKKTVQAGILFGWFLTFSGALHAEELLVSAAMSLKNVFEEIAPVYEQQEPGVTIRCNFGSSGALEKQIEAGAPADIYASASRRFMDMLEKNGDVLSGSRRNFAENSMVLIVPRQNPAGIDGFQDLVLKGCKNIAIGNPGSVPAGRYAKEVLQHLSLYRSLNEKLVLGEHVRQVLDYVARGEVDAGIVYLTDAKIRSAAVTVVAAAPPQSHSRICYPAAVVSSSRFPKQAAAFLRFICEDPTAQKLFVKYGFCLRPAEKKGMN